ncbi:choline dehydrogenase [Phyllosticta citricarpa]|uniref:Choline dehydrogenase n=1 Tax=Phyllosticta citricarpa TaxID=55181 RepID=A0ABR1LMY7_9PEZI
MFSQLALLLAVSLPSLARPINDTILDEYDYISASGLTVANRLTEDSSVTVLVLEAGPSDQNEEWIRVPYFMGNDPSPPADALSGHLDYDWNFGTEEQTSLDGATRHYPLGRGIGGGTLINGLLWNRGNAGDYDEWETLGNDGWNWDNMLQYFEKSEKFTTDVTASDASTYSIPATDASVHGTSGPVNVSFQQYFYPATQNVYAALNELGVPTDSSDPNNGESAGNSFLPMALDPTSRTRSDARRALYDPVSSRDNLYISNGQFVTKLNIENVRALPNFRITGVEYGTDAGATRRNIAARREVILAAGAIHTPLLLQLSGIGDESFLSSMNVTTAVDLPGVGNNYQDHFQIATYAPYGNNSFPICESYGADSAADVANREEFYSSHTGPWTAGAPNGVAFPSLKSMSSNYSSIASSAQGQTSGQYLAENLDDTVIAGYEKQKAILVANLQNENRSQFEILNDNAGHLTYSVMRPFGRGQVRIRSRNPFDTPVIDPRYGSNPIDLQFFMEALRFNSRLQATNAMSELQPSESYPTAAQVADDAQLMTLIKQAIFTEYHPTGTASMMPLDLGGVVDARLKVYGTQNLRIVDGSVMPMIPAAHLQACIYGVAEKAADLIKADATSSSSGSSSTSSINPPSSTDTVTTAPGTTTKPGNNPLESLMDGIVDAGQDLIGHRLRDAER